MRSGYLVFEVICSALGLSLREAEGEKAKHLEYHSLAFGRFLSTFGTETWKKSCEDQAVVFSVGEIVTSTSVLDCSITFCSGLVLYTRVLDFREVALAAIPSGRLLNVSYSHVGLIVLSLEDVKPRTISASNPRSIPLSPTASALVMRTGSLPHGSSRTLTSKTTTKEKKD